MAWQAALKRTNVELELLKDNDQYLFVENGIRGGVAMISTRHDVVNHLSRTMILRRQLST